MTLLHWPSSLRPREKLIASGAPSLTDEELLALFLRTGIKGKNAIQLAHDILSESGGLRSLLNMPLKQACAIRGLGEAKFVQLQATIELTQRYLKETLKQSGAFEDVKTTKQFLRTELINFNNEVFACLFLDNRHRFIAFEKLFFGSINCATVHPRVIVQRALHHNAAAIILSHNHPSGIAEPSSADRLITKQLIETLSLLDIRVLDHIIVAEGSCESFAEMGLL